MTLAELITALVEIDVDYPGAFQEQVFVEQDDDDPKSFWIIVGEGKVYV